MSDPFSSYLPGLDSPADDAAAVTPSNTVDLATVARSLYVGGAGNVSLVTARGTTVTFTAVPAGSILPVRCRRVRVTGTTATAIVALW